MLDPEHNPYAPPRPLQESATRLGHDVPTSARCLRRGWLARTILLSGRIEAVVRYQGWSPGERVYVNGVFVARCRTIYWTAVAPQIDFTIDHDGHRYPATIRAQASYLRFLQLVKFALIVDGDLVYED